MRISNLQIYGLENSIRVSKFPMAVNTEKLTDEYTNTVGVLGCAKAGTGHGNFLKGIIVQFDLHATNKFWIEAERYHWFDIVSAQSTMHKIANIDLSVAFNPYVTRPIIDEVKRLQKAYNDNPTPENYLTLLYNVPSGLTLVNGISTNYLQLKTIYAQRKNHKLPEWREFCKELESLPYSEWITQ